MHDVTAVHGVDEASAGRLDFLAEGADTIFLEVQETDDEMRRCSTAIKKPCMANIMPGGKTPVLPPSKLQAIGYTPALCPVMLFLAITAMQATLEAY